MQKKKFLKYPEFPGGKTEFKKYVLDNLQYPEEALLNHIQGVVHLSAEIDDNGHVIGVHVEKSLGCGCDEEAVRLVSGMHFGGVTNRGIRLKTRKRFRIVFSLKDAMKETPQVQETTPLNVVYNFQQTVEHSNPVEKKSPGKQLGNSFTYTITLGGRES